MTLRERILAVYRGQTPDVVPYMLDLSHWFYHRHRLPWDLSRPYVEPETELIDYHKQVGAGFYLPNLAAFYSTTFPADVKATTLRQTNDRGDTEIVWRIETPLGSIERTRTWEEATYAWGISRWGVRTEADLRVFGYAMSRRRFAPHWERHAAWDRCVGDCGVVYISPGYSAMGHLLNSWMGVEATAYAAVDWAGLMRETVDSVNRNTLDLVDLLCESPAQIVLMGDNFSSDIQPPSFFHEWSRDFYAEAIARFHRAGKFVAVHIDGRLRGAISMIRDAGADCADAVTPAPTGDLDAAACRREAGGRFILSGGVSPTLWMPDAPLAEFEAKVMEWLEQKKTTSRLIANAGDQVPPGADESRIILMRDLVERHGRF